MKNLIFTLIIIFLAGSAFSQQVTNLEENVPYSFNGMDYGYYISNESSKEVKGEEFDRFEVTVYVTNKSGCLKLIPFKNGWVSSDASGGKDEILVAEYNCTNATGKRMTAKKGLVSAKPWYSYVKVPDAQAKDKYKMEKAQVGDAIRNGQTITTRIIVIVPKGEKPVFNCRIIDLPDIQ
jgi:hypothetical protein